MTRKILLGILAVLCTLCTFANASYSPLPHTSTASNSAAQASAPKISTEGNVHWYYIVSAATTPYCQGKTIRYDAANDRICFSDKAFMADRIWSFWQKDGKITIKNYNGVYFGTAGAGMGNVTQFGKSNTPNYIYNITPAFDAFIIKDQDTELHAQASESLIVRWNAEANNASLWKFEEADVSRPEATYAGATYQQGKVTTGIGNKDVPIIRSTMHIGGLKGKMKLSKVDVQISNKQYVNKVKVYIASNAQELFVDPKRKMPWRKPNGTLFGEKTVGSEDAFSITGKKTLTPGDYYIWIACDIREDAPEGATIRAKFYGYTLDGQDIKEAKSQGGCNHDVTIFLSEGSVLMPMDMGSLYYRIPAITCVEKDGHTRLVTLSDDRKDHGRDLPDHCYIVAQYSDDLGKTWSKPKTVAGTAETGGDYGHGDASIVTNRNNGEIVGIMTCSTYGTGFWASSSEKPQTWKTIKSKDGGVTWSVPTNHTKSLYAAGSPNPTWQGGFSGSGAALQKRDGTLVSSFVNRDGAGVRNFHFFMSEDGGDTWHVQGTSGTTNADEPKSLERNNGDLAISVRTGGYNYHNVTSDNGLTWKYAPETRFNSGIKGNACDGEYMVWCSSKEGNQVAPGIGDITFQTVPNHNSRRDVSIALSTDEGETFGEPKTICPTGSAYSAATVLPDGTLGVYYEENGVFGDFTMRFVRFSLNWASNGKYKFSKEHPFVPIGGKIGKVNSKK